MAEICQKVLDGFGISADWSLSITVPISKGKNCSFYRTAKHLEDGMKVVEKVPENKLH